MMVIEDFSSLALLTFGTGSLFIVGKHLACYRVFILAASLKVHRFLDARQGTRA